MPQNPATVAAMLLLSACLSAGAAMAAPALAQIQTQAADGDSLLAASWPAEDICAWPGQAGSFRAGLVQADELANGPCDSDALTAYPARTVPDDMPTEVPEAPPYLLLLAGCGLILLKRSHYVQAAPWSNQPIS
jgi:hypothetical protein